jgi:hypothetical protein
MSTKHIDSAADVARFRAFVRVDCRNCGASRTFDGPELVRACGTGPLRAIERRLKCSRCSAKHARLAVLPPL